MGPTIDELNKILEIKNNIKQSIINKGVEITDNTKFADYPSKIDNIEVGGGGDPYYETLWNYITNNNTDYNYLFHNYNGTILDVSNLDASNVTNMRNMFSDCKSLTQLDVSNWDTGNVTNMNYMFYNCDELTTLDVSNLNTSNVTNMANMFNGCTSLTTLDVSNFNTSNVTDMSSMFYYCHSLTTLNVSNFDISNVTTMNSMFTYCRSLTSLDLSNWDISKVTGNYNLNTGFDAGLALVDFYPPKNISANMSMSNSKSLSHDSLIRIINNLITTTSTKTLTLGATNLAKLTADEVAIATNKGWTVK